MSKYLYKINTRIIVILFSLVAILSSFALYDNTKAEVGNLMFYLFLLLFIIFGFFLLFYYWKKIVLSENNIQIYYFFLEKKINLNKIIGFRYSMGYVYYYISPLRSYKIKLTKNIHKEIIRFNSKLEEKLKKEFIDNILNKNLEVKLKPAEYHNSLLVIFAGLIFLTLCILYGIFFSFKLQVILLIIFISFCLLTLIILYLLAIFNKLAYIFSNKKIIVINKKNRIEIQFSDIRKIFICRKYFEHFYVIETENNLVYLKKRILDVYIGFREYLEEKYGKEINNKVAIK